MEEGLIAKGEAFMISFRTYPCDRSPYIRLLRSCSTYYVPCRAGHLTLMVFSGIFRLKNAAGYSFAIQPVEVPPLRELMPGRVKFLLGLANDEVGYLLPKTQWDRQPPFTYGAKNAPYGEINSCGPDAAGSVHAALAKLCRAAAAQPASRQQDAKLP